MPGKKNTENKDDRFSFFLNSCAIFWMTFLKGQKFPL